MSRTEVAPTPARRSYLWLLLPALVFILPVFVLPMLNLGRLSLLENLPGGVLTGKATLASYKELLGDPYYAELTGNSLVLALEASLLAIVIGYPIALFLYRTASPWRGLLLVLALAPLFTSGIVRVFGWLVILGDTGFVNGALAWLGLIKKPIPLIFNWIGVVIGLAEGLVPFVILSLIAGFGRLDRVAGQRRWWSSFA